MPMNQLYVIRKGVFLLCSLLSMLFVTSTASGQSIACNSGLNASLSDSCRVVIDGSHILLGETNFLIMNYEITVKTMDGQMPSGVFSGSGSNMVAGNVGSVITFTEPGSFKVSVKNLSTGNHCWANLNVEDKLMPKLDGICQCPDTATVVTPECTFSCASVDQVFGDTTYTSGLNPVYRDNCGNVGDVFFTDERVPGQECGTWNIIRTWKTNIYTAHYGKEVKVLACKQKFLFKSADASIVFAPKSKVIVNCGTSTDPESLRNYFSDTLNFTNPNLDSAIICSYPYARDTRPGFDTIYNPIGVRGSAVEKYCKLLSAYTDTDKIYPEKDCPDSYKFVRTWKVIGWCEGTTRSYTQIIAVMDNEAPKFAINDTLKMGNTNPWTCLADIAVPGPIDSTLMDNCAPKSDIKWEAYVTKNSQKITANAANGHRLKGLMPGQYQVIYEVFDRCGNIARDTAHLRVTDKAEPVVITKDKIIVTFTQVDGDCTAKVYPYNIDVGSYDACSDKLTYDIRRLNDTIWHKYVKFTEDDILTVSPAGVPYGEHMIELRVTDGVNNSAIGWSTVRVEDKNSKVIVDCGQDTIRLDCTVDINEVALDTAYAPRATLRSCSDSDLELDYRIYKSTLNNSCNTGSAYVAYFLKGKRDTICKKLFIFGDIDTLKIIYPQEELTVSCMDDDYGDVIITGSECNLLAKSVEEQVFDTPPALGYCKKIVRRFTIIDWCLYQANSNDTLGMYRYNQVIKVKDNTKPVIECSAASFNATDGCGISGFELKAVGIDSGSCPSALKWQAKIDLNGDDLFEKTLTPILDVNGQPVVVVNETVPAGTYKIWWRASDACNNATERICSFTITDNVAPMPQCIRGISTALMNTNGQVTIWAKDYDLEGKSSDECGGPIYYSFSGTDRNMSSMTFDCDDLDNGKSAIIELKVYVWDQFGNNDFCNVTIRVDDNVNVCEDINAGMALLAGTVKTNAGDKLESAEVLISEMSNRSSQQKFMTDVSGEYTFKDNALYNDYSLSAVKNDDVANGISTIDLIMIQQHILSMNLLDSPYKVLAADVSGDQKVTALDLVEIRKIILGTSKAFSTGKSWLFIPAEQKFTSTYAPWPIKEEYDLYDIDKSYRDKDFIAIKLGDVNGNAVANSLLAGTRSNKALSLMSTDKKLSKGVREEVNLSISDDYDIAGFQLQLDMSDATLSEVSVNDAVLDEAFYSFIDNKLTISLSSVEGPLEISLSIIASRDMYTSEAIRIAQSDINSEAYVGTDLEIYNLDLSYIEGLNEITEFDLFQNKPNPFTGETNIGFTIGQSGNVDLIVFDVTGKQIYRDFKYYEAGTHNIRVKQADLKGSGVMYYQLSSGDNVATKKMILLE